MGLISCGSLSGLDEMTNTQKSLSESRKKKYQETKQQYHYRKNATTAPGNTRTFTNFFFRGFLTKMLQIIQYDQRRFFQNNNVYVCDLL